MPDDQDREEDAIVAAFERGDMTEAQMRAALKASRRHWLEVALDFPAGALSSQSRR